MTLCSNQPNGTARQAHHVALLMGSFNGRGVQRMFLNLGAELVRRGFPVSLLVCQDHGRWAQEPMHGMRLEILRLRPPGDWHSVRRLIPLLRYCMASSGTPYLSRLGGLLEFVATERPRVVVSGGTRCNLLNGIARRVSPVPYRAVLTEHNPLSGKLHRVSRKWKLHSVRGIYPNADAIAGVSQGVADELARFLGRRESLPALPNPVVTPLFDRQRELPPAHRWLTDGGPPVLVAIGALEARKNFSLLLHAIARLRRRRPVRLIVLGEGPERRALEACARELGLAAIVSFPGFTVDVAHYLNHAAALALSSTYEGFGCVIVEALACGCPVVSTDCPYGPREILAHGRYGKLVPLGDEAAFAAALEDTLARAPDRHRLQARAREFSVAVAADRYLALMFPDETFAAPSVPSKISS
jgi:glycosyltransferase involved in cell wall biosynthesis